MKNKIYLYSNILFENFIINLFDDYDVIPITENNFKEKNLTNKNILFVVRGQIANKFSETIFTNNNVFVFSCEKQKYLNKYNNTEVKVFFGPTQIKKLHDVVKNYFRSNIYIFGEIKIVGETLSNPKKGLSCSLTNLEKKIFIEFIEHKKIKRDYFLENVLGVNKDIQTKTIESHLTRIRKKLINIKSQIKISSKGDVFFLNS